MSGLPSVAKTSFTAGELSIDLLGRGDLAAYANGASRLRNVFIAPTGGVSRRAGLRHVATARGPGRLIAFEFNTEQTYLLVVTDRHIEVYADDARVTSFATPWTEAQIPQLAWTQNADTLLVTHPEVAPRRITRTSATAWTIEEWAFVVESDVVRQPYHKFAADAVTVTPSGRGGTITLTASAPVFSTGQLGQRLRVGGKEVLVTGFTSASELTCEVKQELASGDATTDWEEPAFSARRGWPVSVCFHQNRLVIGGSRDLPNRLWLSKTSDLFNFDLGTGLDDEAIEFALLSDQVNAIRAVFSGRHLQVFTSGAEWMVTGQPLTPSKIQLSRQTRVGSPVGRWVPPRDVDGATHFVSRDGRDLREFLYADVEQAYQASDLALLSKHLLNAPVDQDYDARRRLFHMVMGDGTLATVTVYRAEKITAWTAHATAGAFRSVAAVEDRVYVLVERDGTTMIEAFDDEMSLDAAMAGTAATPTRSWSGLDHLEGRMARVVADDGAIADHPVSGGVITLAEPARAIQAGLPYAHEIAPLPPVVTVGSMPGQPVRLVRANFRVLDTRALHIDTGRGPTPIPFRRFGRDRFDAASAPFSGDVRIRAIGWRRDPCQPLWRIAQDVPLPCTLLSVSAEIKPADG